MYGSFNIDYITGETLNQDFCKIGDDKVISTGSAKSGDSNSSHAVYENADDSLVESDGSWDSHQPEVEHSDTQNTSDGDESVKSDGSWDSDEKEMEREEINQNHDVFAAVQKTEPQPFPKSGKKECHTFDINYITCIT